VIPGLSISKSVDRAFALLELFRGQRRPMTAAEIGRRLAIPQPSCRVLLKALTASGYLAYAEDLRTYVPTPRVAALGDWLGGAGLAPAHWRTRVDEIAAVTEETTSLCGIQDTRVNVLHVRKAEHPVALQLEPGVGVALWRTAVGRALLAHCDDGTRGRLLDAMGRREKDPAARRTILGLPRELKRIRGAGHLTAYDIFFKGVGAVCVPVPGTDGPDPLVVAVAGLKDRIRAGEARILRAIRASGT
jgi:DNA-binding IclR family transcriptional regulator